MRLTYRMLLGLLTCLVALSACPGRDRRTFEPIREPKTGRLVVYLEVPETVTVDVTVTLASVSAVNERGARLPFITAPLQLEPRLLAGRQVLLGESPLPPGHYRGLRFNFSKAVVKRGPRKSDLAYPEEGWMLEAPFDLAARDSVTLFLTWDPARSLEMGFFFSPHLKAGREVRQIRRLLLYVANEGSNTVTAINRHTGRVVATLAVPPGPTGLATSPDSENLYVVSTKANRLTIFSTTTNRRLMEHRFEFGSEPRQVAVSPDGSRLFVTLFRLNRLIILDAGSLSRIDDVDVGRGPMGVVVEPEGRKVYVANSASRDVSVVSALTGALLATVRVEPTPRRLAMMRNGSEVLVTGYDSSFLSVISVANNRVTRRLNADRWIADIAVDPRLNRFYLVQDKNNSLLYYEPNSQLALRTVPVGADPFRVAIGPDLRALFVVSRKSNTLSIYDRITGELEVVLDVGRRPHDIVVVEVP